MTRLFAAALLLSLAAAPAFACPWGSSATNDTKSRTVASQPTDDQQTPPPAAQTDQKPG